MKEITFKDLNIAYSPSVKEIQLCGQTIEVCQYLPTEEKTKLLEFVIDGAIDYTTNTFSTLRVDVYFAIALCKWYAGIAFTEEDMANISSVYDAIDSNGVVNTILGVIPQEEADFIRDLVEATVADIERYNNSAAGIVQAMSNNASSLDGQIKDILESIQNGEGLEQLAVIKDVVGKG